MRVSTPHSLAVIGDALANGDAGPILGEFHSMRGRCAGKTAAAAAAPTAISRTSTMRASSPWLPAALSAAALRMPYAYALRYRFV
ncbi:hypothetical protein WK56_05485 [Burkholderia ubonensis]|nr:hypothetical protein WK56_05485 [Burkholderia ubonensis]